MVVFTASYYVLQALCVCVHVWACARMCVCRLLLVLKTYLNQSVTNVTINTGCLCNLFKIYSYTSV